MKLQRRAFVSSLGAVMAGITLEGHHKPADQRAAKSIPLPGVCVFGGLCLYAHSAAANKPSRVILPNASDSELGLHKPVLQVPFGVVSASAKMKERRTKHVWGDEFDISDLEVLLPGKGGVTKLHKPTAAECPATLSDWNSMEWVADIREIKGSVRLKAESDWRSIAHAAVYLSGGGLAALPPGRNTKGIWKWTTTGEMGQQSYVRQAITDSVLYGYTSQGPLTFANVHTGTKLNQDEYSLTLALPLMAVTHVSKEKVNGNVSGVTHLHLIDDLLDPRLNQEIIPKKDGDCDREDFTDSLEALAGMPTGLHGFRLAEPFQAWALRGLLKIYYEILLDDYRDCPGMFVAV